MEDKPLWNPTSRGQILRAPRSAPNIAANSDIDRSSVSSTPIIPPEQSKLNAAAAEFIPNKCYYDNTNTVMSKPPQLSVQNRLKIHKDQDSQRNQSPKDVTINSRYYSQGDNNFRYTDNSLDDRRLKQLINTLTCDPGQFDSLLDIFRQTLRPYFEDIIALASVTDLLVSQAIDHQSFRYTAARLCYSIEQESPTFRAQLHLTCERELNSNPNKQGIVLFVAELYTQLHHENIYGRFLLNAFKQLLQERGDNNVKCVCQALKLTGTALEQYDKEALDEVMDMLNNTRQYVSGTALSLLDIVMKLRNIKWGYSSQDSSGSNSEQEAYWEDDVNTVFYNPDGNMLSNEETEFLAANLQSTDEYFLDPSEDPDELCDPEPEMDEEIQAAFKEFVKLGRR